MVKQLTKTGNSLALILPRAILELIGADEHTLVSLRVQDKQLVVQVDDSPRAKKIAAAKAKSLKRYRKTYQKLAE